MSLLCFRIASKSFRLFLVRIDNVIDWSRLQKKNTMSRNIFKKFNFFNFLTKNKHINWKNIITLAGDLQFPAEQMVFGIAFPATCLKTPQCSPINPCSVTLSGVEALFRIRRYALPRCRISEYAQKNNVDNFGTPNIQHAMSNVQGFLGFFFSFILEYSLLDIGY